MSRNPEEEKSLAPWLEAFALKVLPFMGVAAALYLFLVYGALVALMAIFVFLLVWYLGVFALRIAKKLRKDGENGT
jgi:fatty acid desaturase